MAAPGYGEEEEPINTILGKVWSVSFCCVNTRDGFEMTRHNEETYIMCVSASGWLTAGPESVTLIAQETSPD